MRPVAAGRKLSYPSGTVRRVDDDEAARLDAEYDRELDAAAAASELPVVRVRMTPPGLPPPPARVVDRQLAVLTPAGVGEFLRACRASAALSQRAAAEAAGVPQSTWARIESGRVGDVRLSTVVRLAAACGIRLVGVGTAAADGPLLHTDLAQRHRDGGDRWLPAHLANRPRDPWARSEWMFPRYDRPLPLRRYAHRPARDVDDAR